MAPSTYRSQNMPDSIRPKKKPLPPLLLPPSTITVRNVPHDIDAAISAQAKLAGKSKSDYVQEFLTAHFGDLIGNFIRTSELVALMDKDVARMLEASLSDYWFDAAQTLAENRAWCRILGLSSEEQLHTIMRKGTPHLEVRVRQWRDVNVVPYGVSLLFCLFAEAARRDLPELQKLHQALFFAISEDEFLDQIDEMRADMRLDPVERSLI